MNWNEFYDALHRHICSLKLDGCLEPYFRGHRNPDWRLLPSLARYNRIDTAEGRLGAHFESLGAHLLPRQLGPWELLYFMQHHGMPTRLLDWTTNFGVALYFALKHASKSCVVWVLDPLKLNELMVNDWAVFEPEDLVDGTYEDYFINQAKVGNDFPAPVVAILTPRHASRMLAQRGVFTLHKDLETPLEILCPEALQKFTLIEEGFSGAIQFLMLAGINEFSIFPDLDGLARHLLDREISVGNLKRNERHGVSP